MTLPSTLFCEFENDIYLVISLQYLQFLERLMIADIIAGSTTAAISTGAELLHFTQLMRADFLNCWLYYLSR